MHTGTRPGNSEGCGRVFSHSRVRSSQMGILTCTHSSRITNDFYCQGWKDGRTAVILTIDMQVLHQAAGDEAGLVPLAAVASPPTRLVHPCEQCTDFGGAYSIRPVPGKGSARSCSAECTANALFQVG